MTNPFLPQGQYPRLKKKLLVTLRSWLSRPPNTTLISAVSSHQGQRWVCGSRAGRREIDGKRSSQMPTRVAGMPYFSQLGLPSPQSLRPKIKGKGCPLFFQLTALATRGPRPEHRAKWLVTRFLGRLVLWAAEFWAACCPSRTTSEAGSSESYPHMTCDLFYAPGSTSYASDVWWHGTSGKVVRKLGARGRASRPAQLRPSAAASCACADTRASGHRLYQGGFVWDCCALTPS